MPANTACSPLPFNTPPLANDLAFDRAGNLYVTDSLQATIWKYGPKGGKPMIWFQDLRLARGPNMTDIGANGIRIEPNGRRVFFTVSIDGNAQGHVYTLPLVNKPSPANLQVFHTFSPGDIPDGIAFGKNGTLYVADATPFSSGIIGLDSTGTEVLRFENAVNSPIFPYDSPANIAFDGLGSMLVTNHAFVTGVNAPEQFRIIKVFVEDLEGRLFKPLLLP